METEMGVFLTFGGALILIFLLGKALVFQSCAAADLEQHRRSRADYCNKFHRNEYRNLDSHERGKLVCRGYFRRAGCGTSAVAL